MSCLLYYITDRNAFPGNVSARCDALLEKIADCARAGVDYIQLREKDLSPRQLEWLAGEAAGVLANSRGENQESRTVLFINSRVDVALAAGAGGVHLRSQDISPHDVRRIWERAPHASHAMPASRRSSPKPRIAVSCHSPTEVARAEAGGADFAVFAPVFEKLVREKPVEEGKNPPQIVPAGLAQLEKACRAKIPVLALGGITLENARSCLEAGAAGIAAIRLFQENQVAETVTRLRT